MIAVNSTPLLEETEQMLPLLSRLDFSRCISGVLADAQEIRRQLSLYSFRSTQCAQRLCAELTSRYREETLTLYGGAFLMHRQSDNPYMRLTELLSLLVRVAALRLSRAGIISLSITQLTLSDGMLLMLLEKEVQQKADG